MRHPPNQFEQISQLLYSDYVKDYKRNSFHISSYMSWLKWLECSEGGWHLNFMFSFMCQALPTKGYFKPSLKQILTIRFLKQTCLFILTIRNWKDVSYAVIQNMSSLFSSFLIQIWQIKMPFKHPKWIHSEC